MSLETEWLWQLCRGSRTFHTHDKWRALAMCTEPAPGRRAWAEFQPGSHEIWPCAAAAGPCVCHHSCLCFSHLFLIFFLFNRKGKRFLCSSFWLACMFLSTASAVKIPSSPDCPVAALWFTLTALTVWGLQGTCRDHPLILWCSHWLSQAPAIDREEIMSLWMSPVRIILFFSCSFISREVNSAAEGCEAGCLFTCFLAFSLD